MDGILVVDKPAGGTSHDVVNIVRRAAKQKKVGHAGTLDPMATGVLVLALGRATRTIEFLMDHDKVYEARVRLGQTTDTYDAEGTIIDTFEGALPSRERVETALDEFRGPIMQKPPIYSAIKAGGEALYRKARRGENIEVKARPVTIHRLEMRRWEPPEVELYVHCSRGTYIRSLAHDLGEALGTGAYLSALRRVASGSFTLAHAHALDVIRAATPPELEALLLPAGAGMEALPAFEVDEREQALLQQGRALPRGTPDIGRARAVDRAGRLIAVVRWEEGRGWQPEKVFISP